MASEAVDATSAALTAAFNAGDLDAIAECYTEDCKFVVKGGIATGHAGLKEEWGKFLKDFDKIDWSHEDRTISGDKPGDLSCEAGKVSVRRRGTEDWEHGVYSCTFMKGEDGKWRFRYDTTLF